MNLGQKKREENKGRVDVAPVSATKNKSLVVKRCPIDLGQYQEFSFSTLIKYNKSAIKKYIDI